MKFRIEPFVWLAFSGGGVAAALLMPVLVFLVALAFPLGWIDPPDYAHIAVVLAHPITFLVLFGAFVLMLVHAAHRFRYTLYDGLQVKHRGLVAAVCYGGAFFGAFVVLGLLGSAT
jgi:fumarate reductase subunit D